jgi:inhibitor of KinA
MPDPDPGGVAASGSPTFEPIGDAGLLITFASTVGAATAERAQSVAAAIGATRPAVPALGRPVPAHTSILVPFDPLAIALEDVIGLARRAVTSAETDPVSVAVDAPAPIRIEIPVRYGGLDGPDLDVVADLTGLRPADVVELHASATYHVLFLGFAPGFGYLGGLPPTLITPRRASPRERVPAGSVGIAGEQTGVYPLAMPGGWQLIGRTDAVLFDPGRLEPALLRPGASVRFVPVTDR